MKKILLLFLCIHLLEFPNLIAQFGIGSPKVFEQIKKNKLIVVLFEGQENYNETLREYVEENWKYGAYEFVFSTELEDYKKSKDVFFLATKFINYGTSTFHRLSNGLTISNDSDLMVPWGSKSTIAVVPTSIASMNALSKEHLESLLKVLFDVIEEFEKEDLKLIQGKNVAEYYNPKNDISTLKNKTLVLPKSSITIDYKEFELQPEEIAKLYTRKFKIVTEQELSDLIKSDKGQYIYLHASEQGPIIFFYLFDVEQNKMVYFNNFRQGFGATGNLPVFEKVLKDLDELMR